MGKTLLFVSFAVTLLAAGLGFLNHNKVASAADQVSQMESQAASLKKQVQEKEAAVKTANASLTTANTEKDTLNVQLTEQQKQLTLLQEQAKTLTTAKADAETQLTKAQADLKEATDKIAATASATPAPVEDTGLKARVEELTTLNTNLTKQLEAAKTENTKLSSLEEARANKTAQKGLQGRVLAVNPAWNFVVLNLGDRNGLSNNTELLVKRGQQFLGKIRITSVEPSTSIADIVANSVPSGVSISPGDQVIYSGVEE